MANEVLSDKEIKEANKLLKEFNKTFKETNSYVKTYRENLESSNKKAYQQYLLTQKAYKSSEQRLKTLRETGASEEKINKEQQKYVALIDAANAAENIYAKSTDKLLEAKRAERRLDEEGLSLKQRLVKAQERQVENAKKLKDLAKAIELAEKNGDSESVKQLKNEQKFLTDQAKAEDNSLKQVFGDMASEMHGMNSSMTSAFGEGGGLSSSLLSSMSPVVSAINSVASGINAVSNYLTQDVDTALGDINKYMGQIDSRLYGSSGNKNFYDIVDEIQAQLSTSALLSQSDMIESIAKWVDLGVNYNLEQRAFLDVLQDRLVSTFDATNENLLRLIRLQQADTTEQMIGSESYLTKFFNSIFSDTSYLSDYYDTVYGAITDSLSMLNTDQSTQFNFNLQKWLGSLYSVGLSGDAVTNIANAINSLATGDLSGLSGTSSQTLLAMASNEAGLSYADLLNGGLTGDELDDLMKAMVTYLQTIAGNTDSNVVKSKWSELLGLSISDWTALKNLTDQDIASISNYDINNQTALDETQNLIDYAVAARTADTTKVDMVLNNALYSFGMDIAQDESKYYRYKAAQVVSSLGAASGSTILDTISNIISGVLNASVIFDELSTFISNAQNSYEAAGGFGGMASFKEVDGNTIYSYQLVRGNSVSTSDAASAAGSSTNYSTSGTISTSSSDSEDTDTGEVETVETSYSDANMTTFAQQEDAVSATATNVVSGESVTTRDINELYSALFECDPNSALLVRIQKFEDPAVSQLQTANRGSDVVTAINGLRSSGF